MYYTRHCPSKLEGRVQILRFTRSFLQYNYLGPLTGRCGAFTDKYRPLYNRPLYNLTWRNSASSLVVIYKMTNWVLLPLLFFFRLVYTLASQILTRIMSPLIPNRALVNTNGARPNNDTPLEDRLKALCQLARNPSFTAPQVVV
jgi:hypothetical protein